MFRLQNKVVILVGNQQLCDRASTHVTVKTTIDDLLEVRTPTTEVVVDVDNRDLCLARAFFETFDIPCCGQCSLKQLIALGKFKIVDDVDENYRNLRLIRRIPV